MERIGFVGLGTMGAAMAANLRKAGSRSPSGTGRPGGAADLVALGGAGGRHAGRRSPRGPTSSCLRVRHPRRRGRPVRRGRRGRGPREWRPRHRLLDDLARRRRPASRSGSRTPASAFVDAPVSGGSEGAKNATLTIMVGGEPDDVERARPVLEAMGKTVTHFGPAGQRPGGQGRQPGDPRRHVPRRGGGHRARAQGRPRSGGRRRGARRRRRAQLGPREPQRPDDRQRLPARVPHLAPPQGPRHRARDGARGSARRCRSRGWPPSSRPASSRAATATRTCRTSRARSVRSPGWTASGSARPGRRRDPAPRSGRDGPSDGVSSSGSP